MAESVIQAVIGKIVDYSADALKRQVNYLCCYSCNVQTLADEHGELNVRYESVQQDVDAARANLGVIKPEVEAWFRKVEDLRSRSDEILGDAEEIQRSSVCKWLPLLHYSLSRKALKAARDSLELRNTKFDKIFNPVILAKIASVPTTSNVGFESRNFMEDRIMDALKDPSVYSIGIWGIGGVGKTVMAKKIEEKVQNEKTLFEHVVMVVVSQQLNLPKLQSQIAEALSLTLTEESPSLRQKKLHQRLMDEKSILIILDDLWERLDLEEFGIPSQTTHARCKLILTSRNVDVLTSTGVQNIFQLEILTKEESWRFFRDDAGINDDNSRNELVQIAKKVERECRGLPLALKIVASAVKDKDISFWNNTVRELEKSVPDNIPGVLKGVYGPLLYSINALEGKEQKDLFLLCCLFPEDYSISIEELLRCGIGLRIFKESENLTIVRDKVATLLKILLSRSLLFEGNGFSDNLYVRMHDVIRDVGIWITTEKGLVGSIKEKHLFMISHGLNEWPLMMEEDYTCISLLFSHDSIIFPESMVCPKLEFLRLDFVPRRAFNVVLRENFFNGMGELKVLEALHFGLLPPSIGQLNNLRTLFFRRCKIFETTSMLGKLINLEILSMENCEFEMLPVEIGGLKKLKQMHILNCKSLRRIAFGIISRLTRLEELVILGSFYNWDDEARIEGGKDDIACLSELDVLKNLATLKIEIKNPKAVPRQKPLWVQNLKSYDIYVSLESLLDRRIRFKKSIMLGLEVVDPLGDWVYDMANDAEYLLLEGSNCMTVLKGLSKNSRNLSCLKELRLFEFTNILYLAEGLQNGAIFPVLESLDIVCCDSLLQLSNVSPPIGSFMELQYINLERLSRLTCLWKTSFKDQLYLKNLQSIEITECDNLSYMFSLSIVQSLVQLSSLDVSFCEIMKEIFKKDVGELVEINKIELPKLKLISFENLKSFCNFCDEIDKIELPQLFSLSLGNLPSMKMAKGDNNNNNKEVHQQYLIPKVAGMDFNFCSLNFLNVEGIGNFKCMFSPSVISGVPNLSSLQVTNCSMLEQVIGKDDEIVGETILFPNLKELILEDLPNILTFCYNAIQLPLLEQLNISECPQMLKFVEGHPNHISNSTSFLIKQVQCPKLERLTMDRLNISAVFTPFSFKSVTNLQKLELTGCEELEHVITKEGQSTTNMEEELIQRISLKSLTLIKLPKLYGSLFEMKHLEFPSLERIEIEDCPMLEKFSLGSLHLPKLMRINGLLNTEFAASFFFHDEMSFPEIDSENNCFIISVKDISFTSDLVEDNRLCFLTRSSSDGSFVDALSFPLNDKAKKIVGKFKIQKIMTGIVYEILLMIMVDGYNWEDPIEIELKLFGESELQLRTKLLANQPIETWSEISIGTFTREPQQINEEFEFSLHQRESLGWNTNRRLSIKGVRFLEL